MRISHEIFHKPPAFIPLAADEVSERIELPFAAVHESAHGPKRHLVRCKDMSEVEVKADSKANAEFGRD